MNAAHFHLAFVHLPIIAVPLIAALLAIGMWKQFSEVKRIALVASVLISIAAIPIYLSGDSAEEIVEDISGVNRDTIEEHEDAATVSLILVLVTGAVSAVTLFGLQKGKSWGARGLAIVLLSALITSGSFALTAYQGGLIRHPEIDKTPVKSEGPAHER